MTAPRIRSLLFVPGDDERKAAKALHSAADAVILDLEDAVAPERKDHARSAIRAILDGAARHGKPVFVRINALETGLAVRDLAAITGGAPWGIVLPKCRDQQDLATLGLYLDALEAREGLEPRSTRILAVSTETAAATLHFGQAAKAAPRLWGALWGGEDLAASLGARHNRDAKGGYTFPYQFARSQCLYAASALNFVAVDAVYTDIRNLAGLEQETRAAERDGFLAKAAIHPAQIGVINEVFTPNAADIAWASTVVALLEGSAVARLDGRMIDLAHKRIADGILARARGA